MIGYTSTPDYYNSYIAHYGVKGMKWGRRKKKTKTPTIYKYKPARSMTDFESAMYNDPRYKRKTDALLGDKRMENSKVNRSNAMYKDPRYERHTDAMKGDWKLREADPNGTWNKYTKAARDVQKFNYYMPGSKALEERVSKQTKAYNDYQKAKTAASKKKKKRWN